MMWEKRQQACRVQEKSNNLRRQPTVGDVRGCDLIKAATLGPGSWWIHGLYEEHAVKSGLTRLKVISPKGLSENEVKTDGTVWFAHKVFLMDLVNGVKFVKGVPLNEIAVAQSDLEFLTISQLLSLRTRNLGPALPGSDSVVKNAFLQKVDLFLFEKIGRSAVSSLFPTLDKGILQRLGRDLVMVVAAAGPIPDPEWWVCYIGDNQHFYFHPPTFTSTLSFPIGRSGVCEITDSSHVDENSRGQHRFMDWKVCVMSNEAGISGGRIRAVRVSVKPKKISGARTFADAFLDRRRAELAGASVRDRNRTAKG